MNSLQDSIEYGLRKLGYDKIKDNQRKVVEAYVAGRDVLMVAPTGSGKSLIFQIAPFVTVQVSQVRLSLARPPRLIPSQFQFQFQAAVLIPLVLFAL